MRGDAALSAQQSDGIVSSYQFAAFWPAPRLAKASIRKPLKQECEGMRMNEE